MLQDFTHPSPRSTTGPGWQVSETIQQSRAQFTVDNDYDDSKHYNVDLLCKRVVDDHECIGKKVVVVSTINIYS